MLETLLKHKSDNYLRELNKCENVNKYFYFPAMHYISIANFSGLLCDVTSDVT